MVTLNRYMALLGAIACMGFLLVTGCATPHEQLIRAIDTGNLEQVQESLNKGADINDALHRAVQQNQIEIVRLLLKRGVDPNLGNEYLIDELTLVDLASKEQFAVVTTNYLNGIEIVSDNPDVKEKGNKVLGSLYRYFRFKLKRIGGKSPIYTAIDNNNLEIIRALLAYGAVVTEHRLTGKINFCFLNTFAAPKSVYLSVVHGYGYQDYTPVVFGNPYSRHCRLEKDGDGFKAYQTPNQWTDKIVSALDYARSKGNTAVIQLLESAAKTQKGR